jgi:hypothetical protein
MEWYIAVITLLSSAVVGGLVLIVNLLGVIEELRIINAKLQVDVNHK